MKTVKMYAPFEAGTVRSQAGVNYRIRNGSVEVHEEAVPELVAAGYVLAQVEGEVAPAEATDAPAVAPAAQRAAAQSKPRGKK